MSTHKKKVSSLFSKLKFGGLSSLLNSHSRLHALGFKHKAKGVVDSVVNGGELEPVIKE